MLNSSNRARSFPRPALFGTLRLGIPSALIGLAFLSVSAGLSQQSSQTPCISQPCPNAATEALKNHPPDPIDQIQMQEQQGKKDKFEAANAARRKQIADDAARLLQLATELKAAVDKTDKDTLSLDVIRKAESIERLAKGVKEKMKLTAGSS
ncbi:MAG: hypothetical protein WCF17_17310 [Terracidiphilus sp.]